MDAEHFDRLTRVLSGGQSRRGLLAGIGTGVLGLLPAALGPATTAAKKKKKKKKKTVTAAPLPACQPACAGRVCGPDGCGGTCGAPCAACKTCTNGACVNAPDFETTCKTSSGADGVCGGGGCGIPQQCQGPGLPCSTGTPGTCCSEFCAPNGPPGAGICIPAAAGKRCLAASDCGSGRCVGFVCQ